MGYNERFIDSYCIHLPSLEDNALKDSLDQGKVFEYVHFSIVMNQVRKFATYTAHNIDGKSLVPVRRNDEWKLDERVGDCQTGNEAYTDNPWDRGHLVRRIAVAWGDLASQASSDTFYYTNIAPQHQNFNQDEWVELENWVLGKAEQTRQRICVFTGPIFHEEDKQYRNILIPTAFWKTIVLKKPDGNLSTVAFLMKQNEMWNDKNGKRFLDLTLYQVSVSLLEELTDLCFTFEQDGQATQSTKGKYLGQFDPLAAMISEEYQWPVIKSADDIVV